MSSPEFLQGLLGQERGLFRKVVEAVTEDGLEYRPEPRSRCARELIEHLIGHNLNLVELLESGVIHHRNHVPFGSLEEGAARLDESFGAVVDRLGSVDEGRWQGSGRFYVGKALIIDGSCQQLAWMMFLDSVHHRGQLTTYLRPMGSKVPSIYGPSADTPMDAH
ncbi:MAG TPA: DinB family protein [Longimicrobiales bacterium]|nr:DinB family protein [Longimicrobiales bacterium]